jgi:uncharacterized membrane protein
MYHGHLNYFPVAPHHLAILTFVLLAVVALIELRALRYAYMRLGLGPLAATLLLIATLLGSYVNIPLYQLPGERVLSGQEVAVFGMIYVVPAVVDWPGTVVAANLGGAIIPVALSIYVLASRHIWVRGAFAVLGVTLVSHLMARPVPGIGVTVPLFIPPLAATLVALVLSRREAPSLAYVGGCLGTLIGADLLNLDKIRGLGAPVASIGGAGTFDGVFITGIIAVLIASFMSPAPRKTYPRP